MAGKPRKPQDPRFTAIRVDNHFFDDSIGPTERASADKLVELSLAGEIIDATFKVVAGPRRASDKRPTRKGWYLTGHCAEDGGP